jgi:hypothetical protein
MEINKARHKPRPAAITPKQEQTPLKAKQIKRYKSSPITPKPDEPVKVRVQERVVT